VDVTQTGHAVADDRFVVVGLGNPGKTYAGNRHNVGAMIADVLAGRMGAGFKSHKSGADVVDGRLVGTRVVLAKPRSYMNLSGGPVAALCRFFSVEPAKVVALHDELDLPYGTIRVKFGGGEGGHNGLRSISGALGTKDYLRVRFGIGRPPGRMDPADYVLRDFSATERRDLAVDLEHAGDAVTMLMESGLLATQNSLH
jgi:PTH1 family peptidyl-tRNA hydrolase